MVSNCHMYAKQIRSGCHFFYTSYDKSLGHFLESDSVSSIMCRCIILRYDVTTIIIIRLQLSIYHNCFLGIIFLIMYFFYFLYMYLVVVQNCHHYHERTQRTLFCDPSQKRTFKMLIRNNPYKMAVHVS